METSRLPKESERRYATVMFADISGFTAMSEKLDPEEVTEERKDREAQPASDRQAETTPSMCHPSSPPGPRQRLTPPERRK